MLTDVIKENNKERFIVYDPNKGNSHYNDFNDNKISLTDREGIVKADLDIFESNEIRQFWIYSK